ncbi:MAG: glycosyltransferase, partial [Pseudomonadota bacterium]
MTTISAIVPTFQRAGLLVEALRSLFAQDRPVHEIVVWDDGSTDDTGAAVEGLKAEAPVPLRYFRAENAGKSRALNRAMAETTGEAIWICDDDDRCRPGAARLLAAALETAPVAGGSYRRFGLDQETGAAVDADPGYWPDLAEGSMLRHLLEDIFIFQNATLATRQAYDRVGPFREDLPRSIDYDMIVRLAARFPVAFVDAVLFDQRKHDGARGAQAARHAARDSETVWLANDQAVFLGFRETLPLGLYEAMFETAEPALASRAALIQRGAVHARRGLWALALEDIEAAAAMTDAGPLSRV